MRILFLLLLFPIFLQSQTILEVGYKLQLTNSLGGVRQLIIAFDSTTSDGLDICCDAQTFGGPNSFLGIYTQYGLSYYSIMAYDRLVSDRSIGLYTSANPDVSDIGFTIDVVDTIGYENTIVSISDSLFPDQKFPFPYNCVGPITGTRFTFHTSAPVKIDVINGCESDSGGTIKIHNPNDRWAEELSLYGEFFQNVDDTIITNLQIGSYQYKWYNQTGNQTINIQINNNPFNFDLLLPNNYVWIQDPGIIPQVFITGDYDQIIWNFGDGSELRYDDLNPVYYYSEVGQYTLSVTITSGNCSKTIQEVITVDDVFGFPNIKSKKNDYPFYYGLDGRLHKK
jgi:hypothetical protein